MSSFWKFFTGEEGEGESSEGDASMAPESEAREVARSDRPPRTQRPAADEAGASADRPPKREKSAKPSTAPAPNVGGSQPPPAAPLPSVIVDHKPARSGAPPAEGAPMRYGIDEAIKLMRTLPVEENVELVVRVIKTTLESLRVRVGDILEDASRRQDSLRKKISEYQAAIAQFEREIDVRKHEITRLEEELAETTKVKERLQLAETPPPPGYQTGAAPAFRSAPPLPLRPKAEPPRRPVSVPPPPREIVAAAKSDPDLTATGSSPRDVDKTRDADKPA